MYRIVISKQSDPKFLSILNSFQFFFVVLAIWIFTVANSSLDIMTLKYTPYFMVIVGAFSGTFNDDYTSISGDSYLYVPDNNNWAVSPWTVDAPWSMTR